MALILVITDAGRAALVNAKNDGTNAVRIASVGVSATAVTAAPAATTLPGETKRVATISGGAVGKDVMHLVVRDETMDTFTLRSFALYLDNGVLFGLYGQATPIIEKSAQALLLLAVDVTLQDVAAGQITFGDANFLQPPATTDRPGVVELATESESAAGTDRVRAITPYTLRITYGDVWRASNDGAGSGLDADMLDGLQATDFLRRNTGGRPLDYDSGSGQMFIGADTGGWDIGYCFRDSQGSTLASFGASGGANSLGFVYMGPSYAGATTLRVYPDRVTWGANALWHAANDGAGSGLDADLLDGQQGSWYADIVGRLGYTPVPSISYNGYEILSKLMGNDGAGSGLDADLLDGRQAAEFALLAGAAYAGPVATPGLSVDGGDAVLNLRNRGNPGDAAHGWNIRSIDDELRFASPLGVRVKMHPFSGMDIATAITRDGNRVWDAANDGAGSGVDADLLDGQQGSWYADIVARLGYTPVSSVSYNGYEILSKLMANDGAGSGLDADLLDGRDSSSFANAAHGHSAADIAGAFPGSLSENGYTVLPNGLILQWVSGALMSAGQETTQLVYFPVAFPNACFGAVASTRDEFFSRAADVMFSTIGAPSTEAVTVGRKQFSGTSDDQVASRPFIIALGR